MRKLGQTSFRCNLFKNPIAVQHRGDVVRHVSLQRRMECSETEFVLL
jgi:hypothetical protein